MNGDYTTPRWQRFEVTPKRWKKNFSNNCVSSRKGLLSVNCRRQALKLCLDPAIVVIIRIFDQLLLEVFHGLKFCKYSSSLLSKPKKFSTTALSGQFHLRLMLCRQIFFNLLRQLLRRTPLTPASAPFDG